MITEPVGVYEGTAGSELTLAMWVRRRGQLAQMWLGSPQYIQRPFCLRQAFSASERGPFGVEPEEEVAWDEVAFIDADVDDGLN